LFLEGIIVKIVVDSSLVLQNRIGVWELDISLFPRTVASPETLNGKNQSD
jgi:hypothetical protein